MTNDELRIIEKRWQNLRSEAVGGIAKQACADIQAVIDELRRRDKAHRQAADAEAAITGALLGEPAAEAKYRPTATAVIVVDPSPEQTEHLLSEYPNARETWLLDKSLPETKEPPDAND